MTNAVFSDKDKRDISARLHRIEGQVRGLQRMVDEERECGEIVQQLAAARAALDRAGNAIVTSGLRGCLSDTKLSKPTMDRVNAALDALASLRT